MNILLVDDDSLVTIGMKTILEKSTEHLNDPYRICATGKDGNEAVSLYQIHHPDLVLMDIRMPGKDGIEAGKAILASDPDAKIIYLTTFLEDEYIIHALKNGAKGYVLKTDFESLVPVIESVMQGQRVFGDDIVEKIPLFFKAEDDTPSTDAAFRALTEKELELVSLVAEGLSNREIAHHLHFSEGTIRNYLSAILEKLALRDRTQLAIYYYKNK